MKNAFKTGLAALAIAVSVTACGGNGTSGSHPDTTQADPSAPADSSNSVRPAGANGSTSPIDTGYDRSGSGGVDPKKPSEAAQH